MNAFDPQAPVEAKDGLIYRDFAAYLRGEPLEEESGNRQVLRLRREGRSEEGIALFVKAYRQALKANLEAGCERTHAIIKAQVAGNVAVNPRHYIFDRRRY